MSIIAVERIPQPVSIKALVKELKRPLDDHFEALNFSPKVVNGTKTCYIRLSETKDPVEAVQSINNPAFRSSKYHAYIPETVPDIAFGSSMKKRLKRMPAAARKQFLMAKRNANGEIFRVTGSEIVAEMLARYPGLYNLSQKYGHKVMKSIAEKIRVRVHEVISGNREKEESCFQATKEYRKIYPHSGDFQLILSTLHSIEVSEGVAKSAIKECDIAASKPTPQTATMPKEKIDIIRNRYSNIVLKKMTEHVNALNCELTQLDNVEEVAKKQVRQELKKLQPFFSIIVNSVITKHFSSNEKVYLMRIYGSPRLPDKSVTSPFLAKFKAARVQRSKRMFNMLMCSVSPPQLPQLLAMNGNVLDGSTLTVACSDVIMYKLGSSLHKGGAEDEGNNELMDDQETWDTTDDVEM